MARRHRRPKQDVRLAVAESEKRVRADIEALHNKIDQLGSRQAEQTHVSRRRFIKSSALGVAGVATGIIALTTSQPARDFNAVSDHGISGGGTPQITAGRRQAISLSFAAAAGAPSCTMRLRVVPAESPAASGQVLRV